MDKKNIPVKVGDKYAVINRGMGVSVSGPYYVTSIRGSKVSLGPDPVINPKANRDWRADYAGNLHQTARWSSGRAEPWSEKHTLARKRQSLINKMTNAFEEHRRGYFELLSTENVSAILVLLVQTPKEKTDGL